MQATSAPTRDNQTVDSFLRSTMEKNLLKYAVQRQMFCECGQVLDCAKNAVLIEEKSTLENKLLCIDCYYNHKELIDESYNVQVARLAPKYHPVPLALSDVPSTFAVFGTNICKDKAFYTDGSILIRSEYLRYKERFIDRGESPKGSNLSQDHRYHLYDSIEVEGKVLSRYNLADYTRAKLIGFNRRLPNTWDQFIALYDIDNTCIDAAILAQVWKYTKGLSCQAWIKDRTSPIIFTPNDKVEIAVLIMPLRVESPK